MNNLQRLEDIFAHFPGIGPRQAKRFVYYLLNKPPSFIGEFIGLVESVKKLTGECVACHRLFFLDNPNVSRTNLTCLICADATRDQKMLMITARDSDFETIEKSGAYKGLYFILGGTVPILDKEPEKRIRLETLLQYVSSKEPKFIEIIISMNTTPDGDHTAQIVKDAIQNLFKSQDIKISVLGRGLSTGAELEYADSETIRSALSNRR